MSIPGHFKLAYGRELIARRVEQLAKPIAEWIGDSAKSNDQVLALCILRGGVPFFSDLIRALNLSVEPAYCRTWNYASETNAQESSVRVSVDTIEAQGRRILMVDDICDTGATLLKLQNVFMDLGAKEIRSAVLIHRQVEHSVFTPSWSAFEYQGAEWFVGYGLDDKNHFSNLASVYTILPSP